MLQRAEYPNDRTAVLRHLLRITDSEDGESLRLHTRYTPIKRLIIRCDNCWCDLSWLVEHRCEIDNSC